MKKIIRLTEGDLRGIIKRSVNRILREAEGDEDLDYNGFYDSLKTYLENPVDVMKGDYEPSADDINAAMQGLDLDDTDFSDLMGGGDENLYGESSRRLGRIIRESINKVLNEVEMTDSYGETHPDLHGNDPDAWRALSSERLSRMFDIDDEIEDKRNGYVDDIFGTVDNLEKERGRNEWHLGRNVANELELDNSRTDMSPEDTKKEIDKIRRMERPDMPIKTKSRHRYKWQQQMPERLKIY